MCFQILSLIIAAACLAKAGVALAFPHWFYAFRGRQYRSVRLTPGTLVVPILVAGMTVAAWVCFVPQGTVLGWIVTLFLTIGSLLGLMNLLAWKKHADLMLAAIATEIRRQWLVDGAIASIGMVFLLLGLA